MLTAVSEGRGTPDTLEKLQTLSRAIQDTALCGLGQTAPNPIMSTMRYFADEYLAHVEQKRCPAGVCSHLLDFVILDNCVGCGICAKSCPVKCITGEKKKHHTIDTKACIKCGSCESTCPVKAITRR